MKAATGETCAKYLQKGFQSTPPVKAATRPRQPRQASVSISIHAAREGGDPRQASVSEPKLISIHAAREGGDVLSLPQSTRRTLFQSTPPVKAATYCILTAFRIHGYFNPRRP